LSSNRCISCAPNKIPSFILASNILGNFSHKHAKLRFIRRLPKPLNLTCSKLLTPKLDQYFRSYSHNTVRNLLPRVLLVAVFDFNTIMTQM
jgi:hypothetical protein